MRISKITLRRVFLCIVFFFSFTFFRKLLLLIYPFLALAVYFVFDLKISLKNLILIVVIVITGFVSSLFNGNWFLNNALSMYLILPSVFIALSEPKKQTNNSRESFVKDYWKYATIILLIVNLSCVFTFAYTHFKNIFVGPLPMDILDDSFYGLYGKSGLGAHILSIINTIVAIRFLFIKKLKLAVTFFAFSILGFYGLGLVLTIAALGWVFKRKFFTLRNLKFAFVGVSLLIVALFMIRTVNPNNYYYIKNTIVSFAIPPNYSYTEEMKKANNLKITQVPRKITFFVGLWSRLKQTPSILVLGTSPGTYNSRAAYLLNGDLSKTRFLKDNFKNRPKYHQIDIFPLYNTETLVVPWMGGTRNHPFSSIVSILFEYGFLIGLMILIIFRKQYRRVLRSYQSSADEYALRFIFTLTFFLFLFVYYLELIEYMLPLLLLFKSYELDSYRQD